MKTKHSLMRRTRIFIEVVRTPLGFAPEHIRRQFIGIKVPIIENYGYETGNVHVFIWDVIDALRKSGKYEAADFWEKFNLGSRMWFRDDWIKFL